jgi:mRNA interferase MazF
VILAPISSGNMQRVYPFEVRLEVGEGGLPQPSKILLDQIRTVDKSRLANRIGVLMAERMADANEAIRRSLAI